ncbi:hypothetical protein BD560DRAFT_415084 [Blakeslea trispora]|nr:hypothetical protein BD560DRAFT_415084 [Blakeslea trispora]
MQTETSPAPISAKRQSLYTCIRYASRLMKIRTDIRKHRTLPNDCCDPYYTKEKLHVEDELNEKLPHHQYALNNVICPTCPAYQHETQPILSSKITFYAGNEEYDEKQALDAIIDEKEALQEEEESEADDSTLEDETEISHYYTDEYELTLQKLSGIALDCHDNTTFTAVRIKMSPNALAAANAARQKRQKMKINH